VFQNVVNNVVSLCCFGEANCLWSGNDDVFVMCAGVCRIIFAVCWNAVAFWKTGQTINEVCRCAP